MKRNHSLVAALTLATAIFPIVARAAEWTENITMIVTVDGKPAGAARVYDSSDFQRMLLVPGGMPLAFILELGDRVAYSVPADSVHMTAEGEAAVGPGGQEYAAGIEDLKGVMLFTVGEHKYTLDTIPPLIGLTPLGRILTLKPSYVVDGLAYKPDDAAIKAIRAVDSDTEIHVYFGTWCHLCRNLVPKLIKTLEVAANPKIKVAYYGVDEDHKEPAAELAREAVLTTPTILVIRGGREIGRIEEKVTLSLEGDLAQILSSR